MRHKDASKPAVDQEVRRWLPHSSSVSAGCHGICLSKTVYIFKAQQVSADAPQGCKPALGQKVRRWLLKSSSEQSNQPDVTAHCRKHGEGFFHWNHLSCSHESHCRVSLQGVIIMRVIARSHHHESHARSHYHESHHHESHHHESHHSSS